MSSQPLSYENSNLLQINVYKKCVQLCAKTASVGGQSVAQLWAKLAALAQPQNNLSITHYLSADFSGTCTANYPPLPAPVLTCYVGVIPGIHTPNNKNNMSDLDINIRSLWMNTMNHKGGL